MTTIEQTVEIPASRRLTLDISLPETIPLGTARVAIIVSAPEAAIGMPQRLRLLPDENAPSADWRKMRGMFKTDGHEVDRFLAQKHADKTLEYDKENRRIHEREKVSQ